MQGIEARPTTVSTFRVTLERLTIHPHPNADALELAQVGLYRAVVGKGIYKTGDMALYIPEQAVLPDSLIEELGLTGRLAGKAKNRVKAVRLRGEISQGIVCRPKGAGLDWSRVGDCPWLDDYADVLDITKWVPEIPPHMAGEVQPAPELIRWIDIENLQRYPGIFTPGEDVLATEKIHGTACLLTVEVASGNAWVSSKGHGASSVSLVASDTNLYWRAVRQHDLVEKLLSYGESVEAEYVAIFGEVYGAGVQDLHYGANARRDETLGYAAFDMVLSGGSTVGKHWLSTQEFHATMIGLEIPTAPVIYSGPFDIDALRAAANGQSELGGDHIREGVVIRPRYEGYSDVTGGRKIAKLVSPAYLTRGGNATEYE